MPNTDNPKTVTVVIDGASVKAEYRTPLIEVAKKIGVEIPTLCHHEALEPAGACRLCLVEEKRDGWSKFVTACNYPVTDGMVFETDSPNVRTYRKMTAEALLARCPGVPAIKKLAEKLGVEKSRFEAGDDTCILCGMCTRVCESYATSAISTMGRGNDKIVGTFAGAEPEDCVGCGSCASVCPTDHIPTLRDGTNYRIWEKDFPVPICGVDKDKCMACGACEEACPFSIPRVVVKKGGETYAEIRHDACKGCGVCLAACPTGAIEQPRAERTLPIERNKLMVIACGRSAFGRSFSPPVPKDATVLELPCVGGATIATMLGALAHGFDGVLVLGRHEDTCKLDGSEAQARLSVEKASRLAEIAGLGSGRIRFMEPAPGPEGPVMEVAAMLEDLEPSRLKDFAPTDLSTDTMDDVLGILEWLGGRPELTPAPSSWIAAAGFSFAQGGAQTDDIPYLDILLGDLLAPEDISNLLPEQAREAGIALLPFKRNGLVLKSDAKGKDNTTADFVHRLLKQRHGAWRRTHERPLDSARREVTR